MAQRTCRNVSGFRAFMRVGHQAPTLLGDHRLRTIE